MPRAKTIYLPIVFHFHQPIDNFNWVIEDAYQKAYKPLLECLYKYAKVKVALHFSGNLLEWLIINKPDIIEKLKQMANRGQVEMIGGGYYEPIFAIIPYRDKIAQMKKLSSLIKKEFNLEVKGAWLSERVWEPNYPSFLCDVCLKYVIVDDNHFRSTGITEIDTFYSYNTEDEGKILRVFPINEELRYLTPWKPTYLSIEYLKKMADEKGNRMALLISDAEKMGVWGTTHEICYVDGKGHQEGDNGKPFISAFLEQVINNEWIKSITPSEYMEKVPAKNLVYLPTASYDKMEEWVLLTPIRKRFEILREAIRNDPQRKDEYLFLQGGFWRFFLIKYPESNNMHKKMLYVREKLIELEDRLMKTETHKYQNKINEAWDEIYKAQCNDSYWHGLFGGIYLQFLRFSVYTHLINAEKVIDEVNSEINIISKNYISILPMDFNKDSKMDIIIESDLLSLYVDPSDGGTIFELDFKPKSYNILNTLTRWPEAYHDTNKVNKEEVMVDRFKRSMFRTRFLHENVPLKQIEKDNYYEFGDFVNNEFKITRNEKDGKSVILELKGSGSVKDIFLDERFPCMITKKLIVKENSLKLSVMGSLKKKPGKEDMMARILDQLELGIDIPFFFNGDPKGFSWESNQVLFANGKNNELLKPFEYEGYHFKSYDENYNLTLEIEISSTSKSDLEKVRIAKFPIVAFVYTDEGYKKIYQGINVIPRFKLSKNFIYNIDLKIY
ncbi:MAG: alpha-amylase/4-alpha-glucanotransferase domain-containing protein [Promethearchaeota archaeon]